MNFGQAVSSCFANYVTFSGRASRSEYWHWCLFLFVGGVCALIADGNILFSQNMSIPKFEFIFTVVTALPGLAVSVRRLHDVNKSGWWLLIMFSVLGIFLLLYWMLLSPKDEENRF